jgi:hypothetical protein
MHLLCGIGQKFLASCIQSTRIYILHNALLTSPVSWYSIGHARDSTSPLRGLVRILSFLHICSLYLILYALASWHWAEFLASCIQYISFYTPYNAPLTPPVSWYSIGHVRDLNFPISSYGIGEKSQLCILSFSIPPQFTWTLLKDRHGHGGGGDFRAGRGPVCRFTNIGPESLNLIVTGAVLFLMAIRMFIVAKFWWS